MPQGVAEVSDSPFDELIRGCKAVVGNGFDYSEATVGRVIKLTDEELEKVKNYPIKLEICNSFIPGEYIIVEQKQELYDYVREALRKMSLIGIQIVVFGSGRARRIPEGMSFEEGLQKNEEFLIKTAEIAKEFNIIIAIEPLNKKESNIFLTVGEALKTVKKLNHDNIRVLADAYHMYCEDEPLSILEEALPYLVHVHVAEPYNRTCPGDEGGEYLIKFADKLKEIGYTKRVTAECGFKDFGSECIFAHDFMKKTF